MRLTLRSVSLLLMILAMMSIALSACVSKSTPSAEAPPSTKPTSSPESSGAPTQPDSEPTGSAEGELLSRIQNAHAIAWIGPHCDDEIYASGLLALASLAYDTPTYILSLNKWATAFSPGAEIEDRYQDNRDFSDLLNLTDYVYGEYQDIPGDSREEKVLAFIEDFVATRGIDLIITFENTRGANGHPDHIHASEWVTGFATANSIPLYYRINREPQTAAGELDPLPYTDIIDLDVLAVTTLDGRDILLWELVIEVLQIYKTSVPTALSLTDSPERIESMIHLEHYRRVN